MKSRAANTTDKIRWYLCGLYHRCNCDWGCPCQSHAKPTQGNCEGLSSIHIAEGKYENVKLSGLDFMWIGSWPGPIPEGHGKFSLYTDDRASNEQFNEWSKIITRRAKG